MQSCLLRRKADKKLTNNNNEVSYLVWAGTRQDPEGQTCTILPLFCSQGTDTAMLGAKKRRDKPEKQIAKYARNVQGSNLCHICSQLCHQMLKKEAPFSKKMQQTLTLLFSHILALLQSGAATAKVQMKYTTGCCQLPHSAAQMLTGLKWTGHLKACS